MTFSARKSVSVLWALSDPASQAGIVAAHRAGINSVIAYANGPEVLTRVRRGGVAGGLPSVSAPASTPKPKPTPKPSPADVVDPPIGGGLDPQFGSCRAAKSAGYGSYYAGTDAEYAW